MTGFIGRRIFESVLALLAVTLLAFLLVRTTGDPVLALSSDYASEEAREELRRELGLDRPLHVQYGIFVADALRGEFGESLRESRPARDVLLDRLPATFKLGGVAVLLGALIGVPLGVVSAARRGGVADAVARGLAILGQSVPVFVTGIVLVWFLALTFRLLPTSGLAGWRSYVMPSIALGWFVAAGITRLVRSSMLQILGEDYIKFARIKGLSEHRVIWAHAFRNAAIPALTFFGIMLANVLTGSLVVEALFAWPGAGRLAVTSVLSRDYPVIQMIVVVFTAIFVLINLVVDLLYVYLDPRIRLG